MQTMTRGELARRCGVNFETVRYYEQKGLIPGTSRSSSNYRIYGEDAVRRIRFIRRAQDLGFTLAEIKDLLSLRAQRQAKCADVLARAQAKIRDIDRKIQALQAMRGALLTLERECRGAEPLSACPILGALDVLEEGR